MGHIVRSRSACAALVVAALAQVAAATVASASEVQASGSGSGFRIHGLEETLRDFVREDSNGRLWLDTPSGARFELVRSTSDPVISNPGDGAFHPFEESEVQLALAGVRFPLTAIAADVLILPYPRRDDLGSAAGPGLILLSPGVRPLPREQQHAEFTHELGHVVQQELFPDSNRDGWQTYRRLRGIEDPDLYNEAAPHADRPHEIFAEDFRVLFGDALANYSGSIENPALVYPRRVEGLEEFMLDLAGVLRAPALRVTPNPSRGPLRFYRTGQAGRPIDLFDSQGRRVATVAPVPTAAGEQWTWGGTDGGGRRQVGVLFARLRDAAGPATRVTLLP